ncbi:MAG TPA: hypothetical protein VFG69_10735, partial [Nannocystaceae bacterium]|nr:hypothetical protein [Nannocystaceae bacterium]
APRRIALLERALELYGEGGPDPRWLASMRVELAEALWSRRAERPRALALATAALADIDGLHDADAEIVRSQVTAWLAPRRATRPRT